VNPHDVARRAAAAAAVALVEAGAIVGLGTGDTAAHAVRALAARARGGLDVTCVATSCASAALGRAEGLRVVEPDDVARVDVTIDGADELDGALRLLKGGGGALTREKLVARASARLVIVVDAAKRVARLGATRRLPVEIAAFGARWTLERLAALGLEPRLRAAAATTSTSTGAAPAAPAGSDGPPFVTDGGGYIADCLLGAVDLDALAAALDAVSGVVEHGLFLTEAERAYVGDADGRVTMLTRERG
jgi:ribose 5-phosphate isomerase A